MTDNESSPVNSRPETAQSQTDKPLIELIKDEKLLETLLEVFEEEYLQMCLNPGSKWQEHEECMKILVTFLQQSSDLPKGFMMFPSVTLPIEKAKVFVAVSHIIIASFSSKMLKVLLQVHLAFRAFLDSPMMIRLHKKEDFTTFTKSVTTLLVAKAGDMNPRNQKEAIKSIKKLCSHKNTSIPLVMTFVLEPIKTKTVKVWVGRLYLLEVLIKDLHVTPKGVIEPQGPIALSIEAAANANAQIRMSAISVLKEVYKDMGTNIYEHIKQLKPTTLAVLRNGFEAVDLEQSGENSGPSAEEKQATIDANNLTFSQEGIQKEVLLKKAHKNNPKNSSETLKQYLARLTHISLDNCNIDKIDNLQYCTSLRVLYLYDNRIYRIENLKSIGKNITHLYLQNNKISKMENMETLVNLQKLYLDNNQIEVVENLQTMNKLEELYISNQDLPEGFGLTFDENSMKVISSRLTLLNASNCMCSDVMSLGWLENLTKLNLSKNKIENLEAVQFVLSSNMYLQELDLSSNPINKSSKYRDKIIYASKRDLELLDNIPISSNERKYIQNIETKRRTTEQKQRSDLHSIQNTIVAQYIPPPVAPVPVAKRVPIPVTKKTVPQRKPSIGKFTELENAMDLLTVSKVRTEK
ncbi:hypothetical protein AKO1_013050 [Acrasis kona]|uniref:Uncharacterized protein n=1 Tax=Acrasis kona TaxID=1008807 RepID=A0AAW2Z1B7_9EUKA